MTDSDEFHFNHEGLEPSDIDNIKKLISHYFSVYDIRWSERTAAFYFTYPKDEGELEQNFENLRLRLKSEGLIPRIANESGEYIIYVVKAPRVKKRSIWINILLIIITIITTTWAGSILWYERSMVIESDYDIITPLLTPDSVLFGFLSFALPLMLILGTHETAHYFAAKRHNIDASLPYFIPLPPPFILGTMGAFISMREPISNKKALLDIGAAGPIAGFLVSIPVLLIGFTLENLNPVAISNLPSDVYIFNEPLLFTSLRFFFPTPENSLMHPTVFAGWVGLFVTALNLLPGGQLDGGHIARALLGNKARFLSLMVVVTLFILSFITQFMLWIIFAFFILLLGTSHPPPLNDFTPLGTKRQSIGALCMVMLLICIHYAPIIVVEIPQNDFEFECENANQVVDINGTAFYLIEVTNTADEEGYMEFNYTAYSNNTDLADWSTEIQLKRIKLGIVITNPDKFKLKAKESFLIWVNVTPNPNVGYGGKIQHIFNITFSGMIKNTETYTIQTQVGTFDLNTLERDNNLFTGYTRNINISATNLLNQTNNITLNYTLILSANEGAQDWVIELDKYDLSLAPLETTYFFLHITPPDNTKPKTMAEIELLGISELNSQAYETIKFYIQVK